MKLPRTYDDLLRGAALRYALPFEKLKAQMLAESWGNRYAVSPVGAVGLMQFMPRTWTEWGLGKDPFDPEVSIDAGARYMRWLVDQFDGDYEKALAAYNAGIGRVKRIVEEHGDGWRNHLPGETRVYLRRIADLARDVGDGA